MQQSHSHWPRLCRIVRTNITENLDPQDWTVILPEHEKDILTGSTHLKVTQQPHLALSCSMPLAASGVLLHFSGLHGVLACRRL